MRASRQMLSEVRRAFWLAGLLGGCISLLTLLTARLAAEMLDAAVPLGNLQAFVVLVVLVAGCTLAIAFTSFMRDNILCRAGLWLHHELGHAVRAGGGRASLRKQDRDGVTSALDTFTAFMTSVTAGRAVQSVWAPVYVVALYIVEPIFAGIAVCAALALTGMGLWLAKGIADVPQDARRAHAEADAATSASPQSSTVQSVEAWEHANCFFVAACYARHKRTGLAHALVLAIRGGALLAALSLLAWWAANGTGLLGTWIAGAFLLDRLLAPLGAVACSAATVRDACSAYRRLRNLAHSTRNPALAAQRAGLQDTGPVKPVTAHSKSTPHRLTQPASQALH